MSARAFLSFVVVSLLLMPSLAMAQGFSVECRYGGGDCEHVALHREMAEKGMARLFLNPGQIADYGEKRSRARRIVENSCQIVASGGRRLRSAHRQLVDSIRGHHTPHRLRRSGDDAVIGSSDDPVRLTNLRS